jgi:hypothetical protein
MFKPIWQEILIEDVLTGIRIERVPAKGFIRYYVRRPETTQWTWRDGDAYQRGLALYTIEREGFDDLEEAKTWVTLFPRHPMGRTG